MMMPRAYLLVLLFLSAVARQASGQGLDVKPFFDTHYYDPLRAEPHAARIKLLLPAWSAAFPDSLDDSDGRFAWQVSLGRELPIVAFATEALNQGRVGRGHFGFALCTPVGFHMIEDFKDPSNPIVDTDYRFGFTTKTQYGLSDEMQLGIRFVPWAHESTHLGDEYVLVAAKNPDFERINVSYEYWEVGVSVENEDWTLRVGGLKPWGADGYYSDHLLGSDITTLTASTKNFELSLGAEYRFPVWKGRRFYLSADTRNKLRYTYHATPANPEERQWSTNFQVGRTLEEDSGDSPLQDYFLQVYYGVNPYGQLRSMKSYWSVGFGWGFGF
jgi:hypothetical protein